ncbi:MAG: ABC-2 family transporter protein [bacterium]|nr:ABC-2 family transporter protein [bacterium]
MRKYLHLAKVIAEEYFAYRLNFILWRVRMVLRLLTLYFLWETIFRGQGEIGNYNHTQVLTYVLLSSVLVATVISSRTIDAAGEISRGDLSNWLVRPLSYFKYYISKDCVDKLLNIGFAVVEIAMIVYFLKPAVFLQTNIQTIFLFLLAAFLATVLFFLLSFLISFIGFWSPEVWAPRFLLIACLEFLSGGLFPLDLLPKPVFEVLTLLPFNYLLYFPAKIYLGQLSAFESIKGMFIAAAWVFIFYRLFRAVWKKGLRAYSAEGR